MDRGRITEREQPPAVVTGWPPLARLPGPILGFVVALTYLGLAQYVIVLNDPVNLGAGFWPAAGFTVAALLSLPSSRWGWVLAAVFAAELGSDLIHDYDAVASLWWAAGNTVEPLVGAALLRRFGNPEGELAPIRQLVRFVACAVIVAALVGGTVGSIGSVAVIGHPFWVAWPKYVIGDALGVLVVAPLLLIWRQPAATPRSVTERVVFGVVLASVTFGVFRNWNGSWDLTLPYLVVPVLTWAALRFGVRGTALTVFTVTQVANWATAIGYGPFALTGDAAGHAVTMLQLFLGIVVSASLIVAALVTELTGRVEVERLLAHQARHDQLTGLPHRRTCHDEVGRALSGLRRGDGPLGVYFIDLDRFKLVNDTFGHEWGDQLLVQVAERLTSIRRPGDVVARVGGDEFVLLCRDLGSQDDAARIARRVLDALEEPFRFDGRAIVVSGSVGITVTTDPDADPETLIRDADTAMYRAKDAGKARFEFCDDQLRQRVFDRLALEEELRTALRDEQFRLVYQPIVEVGTARIVGAEALLRWQHPDRGLLAPGDFLAAAEDSGLIVPIGEWALGTAIHECATWPDDTAVSVNLSPRQLFRGAQEDLVGTVARTCTAAGISPSRLWLEVVEDAIGDVAVAIAVLEELTATGVVAAIDDFGTGYASLARLRELPFGVCKIDRSFIAALDATDDGPAVVRAIVQMAHAFGMRVVAEGIETPEQLARLQAMDCDLAQGFHLHRPMPAADLRALLACQHRTSDAVSV